MIIATLFLAAVLRVDPPSPDTFTRVKLTMTTIVCGFPVPQVTVTGRRIDIDVHGEGICIPELFPQTFSVWVGPLPAGIYDVHAKAGLASSDTTFIVRDTSRVLFTPYAAPITGGVSTMIERTDSLTYRSNLVRFGNGPQTPIGFASTPVPPSSFAGLVEVTLSPLFFPNDPEIIQPNAFLYFDPAQPPDLAHAEPVLFPIAFDGDGALGSQWRTENTIAPRYNAPGPVLYRPLCDGCPAQIGIPTKLPSMSRPDGYVLWLGLGSGELLNATSRIRDLSRASDNLGTAIPVVRPRDFAQTFVLTDIPADARYRAMLRVWSLDADPVDVSIESLNYRAPLKLTRVSADGPLFGSLDLGDALAKLPAGTTAFNVRVSAVVPNAFIWPMISVTNNQTQQVSIFAPESL